VRQLTRAAPIASLWVLAAVEECHYLQAGDRQRHGQALCNVSVPKSKAYVITRFPSTYEVAGPTTKKVKDVTKVYT
jgi:hypothetical protein